MKGLNTAGAPVKSGSEKNNGVRPSLLSYIPLGVKIGEHSWHTALIATNRGFEKKRLRGNYSINVTQRSYKKRWSNVRMDRLIPFINHSEKNSAEEFNQWEVSGSRRLPIYQNYIHLNQQYQSQRSLGATQCKTICE